MKGSRRAEEAAQREGWNRACQLYRHLAGGGQLVPLPASVRLEPGEAAFADGPVGIATFHSYDRAETAQMLGPFLQTLDVRHEIEDLMTPRWRGHSTLRCVLTSHRLLVGGQSWQSLWHEDLMELTGNAAQWTIVLAYEQLPPLMLFGPSAPFFGIMLARLTYGPQGLGLPVFVAVATAVAMVVQMPPPESTQPHSP